MKNNVINRMVKILAGVIAVLVISSVMEAAVLAKTGKNNRYVENKIIYQKHKNGTLSVCGYEKGITAAHIAGTIKGMKVTGINWDAFYKCKTLKRITIPDSVKNISVDAFSDCSKLNNIYVDEKNKLYCSQEGVLFDKDKTKLLCYPMGRSQTSYRVPASVKTIGSNAFKGAVGLKSLIIPGNVKTVDGFAFNCCTSLANVTIEEGVKTIDGFAFSGCRALAKITIPQSVTRIGYTIFAGCKPTLKITYKGSLKDVKWF